ncbi:MAG: aminoacyl-tRNA hydrolase [Candidatus Eremiobacteraeota bacterium]|nr:aminoacyl-tRNA hydrolase [Candidatus Eremiobacteraeota bacterium]MBV9646864.1 aminoacyl-tRNA hydrolase [Candidatus Eremiobacteraeota bacterium]
MVAGTRLIVGLGNPGPEYAGTRHNAGFMVVDEIAKRLGVTHWRKKDFARQAHVASKRVVLVEPITFMNNSGWPVRKIASWWKTPRPEILVISDDLDLPFGKLRLRANGSSGGHNGLKSLIDELGGQDFPRLRVGIGRGREAIDHVLGDFHGDERETMQCVVDAASDGALLWLDGGIVPAMNAVNGWRPPDD